MHGFVKFSGEFLEYTVYVVIPKGRGYPLYIVHVLLMINTWLGESTHPGGTHHFPSGYVGQQVNKIIQVCNIL